MAGARSLRQTDKPFTMLWKSGQRQANNPREIMSDEQDTLLMIRGAIATMPPETQECVHEMAEHIRAMIRRAAKGEGQMAVALVGAELAANDGELPKA